jgi:hypothetical protein
LRRKIPLQTRFFCVVVILSLHLLTIAGQRLPSTNSRLVPVAEGWAKNQINAVIFRRNSVTTHGDTQYVAFYDASARVVLAKRKLDESRWQIHTTQYQGDIKDAHKTICIAVDGEGFLHMAWNHHVSRLQYCRTVTPNSLELAPQSPMVSDKEERVTYPEFYNLANGNLLFLYRDGASGNGNLILNHYDVKAKKWTRLQDRLIDGEGERNAYWQMTTDAKGAIHISWVWRETPDVATNHDLCYAKSTDGGKSWQKSTGEKYQLPITAKSAEYVWRIPQGSELINQTSMCADASGKPFIATYWRPQGSTVPQYHLVYQDGVAWQVSQVTRRQTPFSLSGGGTRRIPISRPQILIHSRGTKTEAFLIFRDSERGNRVSVAKCFDLKRGIWAIEDITQEAVGMWEPTLDQMLWNQQKKIHLLVQNVGQGQGETLEDIPPQMVSILEWLPK